MKRCQLSTVTAIKVYNYQGSNSKTVFFKSEKASYIMLRKYFDEIEEKIEMLRRNNIL